MALPLRLPSARFPDAGGRALLLILALAAGPALAQQGDVAREPPPEPAAPARVAPGARVPVPLRKTEAGGVHFIENSALLAEVSGLKPDPKSFLAVRAGPGPAYRELDRLKAGRKLIPLVPDFEWIGVVYGPPDAQSAEEIAAACKLDEASAAALAESSVYAGPCKSGWVSRKWVKTLVD
jgi:hypothetical protein